MSDRRNYFLDLDKTFSSIGSVALRSKRDWSSELADLSERLCKTENKNATQIDQLLEGYYKDLIAKIYSPP